MVHDHLVCNETSAQLSDKYGLTERLRTSQAEHHHAKMLVKIRGSLFESYTAAVCYDYLSGSASTASSKKFKVKDDPPITHHTDQVSDVSSPVVLEVRRLDKSPQPPTDQTLGSELNSDEALDIPLPQLQKPPTSDKPSPEHLAGPPSTDLAAQPLMLSRSYDQALDHIYTWLKPLFIPIIEYTLEQMRMYQRKLEEEDALQRESEMAVEDQKATGALSALNQYYMVRLKSVPQYETVRAGPSVWQTTCTVTLLDGSKVVGVGQRKTKKAATSIASYEACIQLKIVKGRSKSEITAQSPVARSPVKKTPYGMTVLQGQEERKEREATKTAERQVHGAGVENEESEEKEEGEETAKAEVQMKKTGASPVPSVVQNNEAGSLK